DGENAQLEQTLSRAIALKEFPTTDPGAFAYTHAYSYIGETDNAQFNIPATLRTTIDKVAGAVGSEQRTHFDGVLEDARIQVRANPDSLAAVMAALREGAATAVATMYNEDSRNSPTWAQSDYRLACDKLFGALYAWDKALRETANPTAHELLGRANDIRSCVQ